jgi:GDP-mannose 6-dehydrogenase
MRVAVFGMGYVGCVSAAVLAREGHDVVGVDTSRAKVEALQRGESPVLEPSLGDLVRRAHAGGRLTATSDGSAAARGAEVIFVCVGTPSAADGATDVTALQRVATDIGVGIGGRRDFPVVALRSTALPAVIDGVVVATLERVSGMRRGVDFGFVVNPELLREGSGVEDFDDPPFTVLGTSEDRSAAVMMRLYEFLASPVVVVDAATAALVKYACNAFHALKVAFANEMAAVARAADVDGGAVMRLLCMDEKLNLSAAYLRPGMPFGGSCLPKDVRALAQFGRSQEAPVSLLESILESNRRHVETCVQRILAHGRPRVGVLGMAFKAGTDDVRESPTVAIVEALLAHRLQVAIYDGRVSLAELIGANREYVERRLPQLATLVRPSIDAVLRESDVLVVANGDAEFAGLAARLRPDQILIDLVGRDDLEVAAIDQAVVVGLNGGARPGAEQPT